MTHSAFRSAEIDKRYNIGSGDNSFIVSSTVEQRTWFRNSWRLGM